MLNWNSRKNVFTTSFLLVFAAFGGMWTALYLSAIVQFKATSVIDAAILLYWLLPTILAILCVVALKYKNMASAILWICACFWLFVCGGELMEGNAIQPNTVTIVLGLIISAATLVHLVAIRMAKNN